MMRSSRHLNIGDWVLVDPGCHYYFHYKTTDPDIHSIRKVCGISGPRIVLSGNFPDYPAYYEYELIYVKDMDRVERIIYNIREARLWNMG